MSCQCCSSTCQHEIIVPYGLTYEHNGRQYDVEYMSLWIDPDTRFTCGGSELEIGLADTEPANIVLKFKDGVMT